MITLTEDKAVLWRMMYAHRAFEVAKVACKHIMENGLKREDALYWPLVTSICISYGKPFKLSKKLGRMPETIVPSEYRVTHNEVIELRDKMFAHTDADGPVREWGTIHQVRFKTERVDRGVLRNGIYLTELVFRRTGFRDIANLCAVLMKKCDYHINKIRAKHQHKIPRKPGEYLVDLSDTQNFVTSVPPIDFDAYTAAPD